MEKIDFSYSSWLALDMLVFEEGACDLCNERAFLRKLIKSGSLPSNHSLRRILLERVEELEPRSTESPVFLKKAVLDLPRAVHVGRVDAKTFELAYLEFSGQMQSGYPMNALIQQYQDLINYYSPDEIKESVGLRYLQLEMVRTFLQSWHRVTGQWAGPSLKEALEPEVTKATPLSITILSGAGWALAERNAKTKVLRELFSRAALILATLDDSSDPTFEKRENLYIGGCLYCIIYLEKAATKGLGETSKAHRTIIDDALYVVSKQLERPMSLYSDLALRNIRLLLLQEGRKDDFLPALFNVLDHTVRAARSAHHAHLIPSLLTQLVKGRPLARRNYSLLRDTLSHFLQCFATVVESFPELLNKERAPHYTTLRYYAGKLLNYLGEGSLDEEALARIRIIAGKVRNVHPYHLTNPLLTRLAEMQVSLDSIFMWLEEEANSRGIKLFRHSGIAAFKGVHILCRNQTMLYSIIDNFTFQAMPERKEFDGRIFVEVLPSTGVNNISSVKLVIRTNYGNGRSGSKIRSGPGLAELGSREFGLFGIKGDCRSENMTIEDSEYDTIIELEFCKGFPAPKSLNEEEFDEKYSLY